MGTMLSFRFHLYCVCCDFILLLFLVVRRFRYAARDWETGSETDKEKAKYIKILCQHHTNTKNALDFFFVDTEMRALFYLFSQQMVNGRMLKRFFFASCTEENYHHETCIEKKSALSQSSRICEIISEESLKKNML